MLCTSGFVDDVMFARNGRIAYFSTGAESDDNECLVDLSTYIVTLVRSNERVYSML